MQSATASFDQSAAKIADPNSEADPITEITNTIASKAAFTANVKVAEAANEMQKKLLDITV